MSIVDETVERPLDQPVEAARRCYADVAAELHRIADELAAIRETSCGQAFQVLVTLSDPTISANSEEAAVVADVDAVGVALLGQFGSARAFAGDSWYHEVLGKRGPVMVYVQGRVTNPKERELARLRAENEALRQAASVGSGVR